MRVGAVVVTSNFGAWARVPSANLPRRAAVMFGRTSLEIGRDVAPAAAVATARKLAILIWHVLFKGTEYLLARPSFTAMKLRKAALKAGAPREHGNHAGPAHDYWIKDIRQRENEYVERAERAYELMVEAWKTVRPAGAR